MYTSLRKLDEKGEWRQPKLNLLGVSEKDGGLHEPLERARARRRSRAQGRLEAGRVEREGGGHPQTVGRPGARDAPRQEEPGGRSRREAHLWF